MLDFVKYTRFKLREQRGFCTPKAPEVRTAKRYTYKLGGSSVSFKAPTQVHLFRPDSEQITSKITEDSLDILNSRYESSVEDTWQASQIFKREYALYGPWFTGEKSTVSFSVGIAAPKLENRDINFLNPKAFETAISGYLTEYYGKECSDPNISDYVAPLDWAPVTKLPVPAAKFLVQSEAWHHRAPHFCFPISRNRIVVFYFQYRQRTSGSFEKRDSLISPKPALNFIKQIIDSVKISPSSSLNTELAELRKTCPDLSVSKDFPPLKWPATVDETGLNIVELNAERRKALAG